MAVRYSYSLVPLGFGIWLAHFGFHFLTGLYTFIPVTQAALADSVGPSWASLNGAWLVCRRMLCNCLSLVLSRLDYSDLCW